MRQKPTRAEVRQSILHAIDVVWKRGTTPIIPPESPNVASLIFLKDDALAMFADEMERQRRYGNLAIEHAVYVTPDGGLIVTGSGQKGAFSFLVPAGGWGWCRPLM